MKKFNTFIEESSKKRCPAGQYYCFDEKKCKKTPKGYHIGGRGYLERDDEETNGNGGNGNGNGGNGNGNGGGGNGGGGNGGGGGGE